MKRFLPVLIIIVSFMLASMINVYPLSFAMANYRPMVLVLVLIFWAIYQPKFVGLGVAFLVGLSADLLLDTHLGHQAFCAVATIFVVQVLTIYTKRLDFASVWVLAIASLAVYRLFLWLFQSFSHASFALTGFASFAMSVLAFPVVWWVLSFVQRKIQNSTF